MPKEQKNYLLGLILVAATAMFLWLLAGLDCSANKNNMSCNFSNGDIAKSIITATKNRAEAVWDAIYRNLPG